MIVLAVDTAFDACSAAILSGERVLWSEQHVIGKGHSEVLPPMIARGLRSAAVAPGEVDRIGVVIGPGAFAGVRVGLAFARAFRIGLKADVVGINSAEALAVTLSPHDGFTAIVFDARRGQVYAALYDSLMGEILPPFAAAPEIAATQIEASSAGENLRLAGSGARLIYFGRPHVIDQSLHSDPTALARRAAAKRAPGALPTPLYLRPPDAAPAAPSLFAGLAPP